MTTNHLTLEQFLESQKALEKLLFKSQSGTTMEVHPDPWECLGNKLEIFEDNMKKLFTKEEMEIIDTALWSYQRELLITEERNENNNIKYSKVWHVLEKWNYHLKVWFAKEDQE